MHPEVVRGEPGSCPVCGMDLVPKVGAGGMRWLINGLTYDIEEYPVVVERGATEVWEYRNDERSMAPHDTALRGTDPPGKSSCI